MASEAKGCELTGAEQVLQRFLSLRMVANYDEGVDRERVDKSRLKAVVDGEVAGFGRAQDAVGKIAEEVSYELPPLIEPAEKVAGKS